MEVYEPGEVVDFGVDDDPLQNTVSDAVSGRVQVERLARLPCLLCYVSI